MLEELVVYLMLEENWWKEVAVSLYTEGHSLDASSTVLVHSSCSKGCSYFHNESFRFDRLKILKQFNISYLRV